MYLPKRGLNSFHKRIYLDLTAYPSLCQEKGPGSTSPLSHRWRACPLLHLWAHAQLSVGFDRWGTQPPKSLVNFGGEIAGLTLLLIPHNKAIESVKGWRGMGSDVFCTQWWWITFNNHFVPVSLGLSSGFSLDFRTCLLLTSGWERGSLRVSSLPGGAFHLGLRFSWTQWLTRVS